MSKERKLIDLDTSIVKSLSIQAIQSGHKNFKRYVEHVLRIQAASKPLNIELEVDNEESKG